MTTQQITPKQNLFDFVRSITTTQKLLLALGVVIMIGGVVFLWRPNQNPVLPNGEITPTPTIPLAAFVERINPDGQGRVIFTTKENGDIEMPAQEEFRNRELHVVSDLQYERIAFLKDKEGTSTSEQDLIVATKTNTRVVIPFAELVSPFSESTSFPEVTEIDVVSWSQQGIVLEYHSLAYLTGIAIYNPDEQRFVAHYDLYGMQQDLPRGIPVDYAIHGSGRYVAFSTFPLIVDEDAIKSLQQEGTTIGLYVVDLKEKRTLLVTEWKFEKNTNATTMEPHWWSPVQLSFTTTVTPEFQLRTIDFEKWQVLSPAIPVSNAEELKSALVSNLFYCDTVVGSGHCESIKFLPNGSYVYASSEYDKKKTFLAESGTYSATSKDTIILRPQYRINLQHKKITATGEKKLTVTDFVTRLWQNSETKTVRISGEGFSGQVYWSRGADGISSYSDANTFLLTDMQMEEPLNRITVTVPKTWTRQNHDEFIMYSRPLSPEEDYSDSVDFMIADSTGGLSREYMTTACADVNVETVDLTANIKRKIGYCGDSPYWVAYTLPELPEINESPRIYVVLGQDYFIRDSAKAKSFISEIDSIVKSITFRK